MRTTLTLDPDVAAELGRRRKRNDSSLKQEVNTLLRLGLRHVDDEPRRRPRFEVQAVSVGEIYVDLDDIEAALELAEGPDHK